MNKPKTSGSYNVIREPVPAGLKQGAGIQKEKLDSGACPVLDTGSIPDKIEGWAIIHVSQVGRRKDLASIRLDKRDGKGMEPSMPAGSKAAVGRGDREIRKNKPYAVQPEWGSAIKSLQSEANILIMMPESLDREASPIRILDSSGLNYNPVVGRVIWNWQTL